MISPHRLWIIEDNRAYREAISFALEPDSEIRCEQTFSTAEAALDHLRTATPPNVILLDLDLPGMNGLEALREIKQHSPAVHVLILTEFDDRPKVFQAISEGASGYLLKSSPVADIARGIHDVMAGGAPLNARIARMMLSSFTLIKPARQDSHLTTREHEVLTRLAAGAAKKHIAAELNISYHTVDMHTRSIYRKLQVNNLSGAVSKALHQGLV